MADYVFDIVRRARDAGGGDGDVGAALSARPFQLFYASEKDEVAGYQASDELVDAVNVSIATGRPLLLTGEPGTGKTSAATWIAGIFGLSSDRFQVKSTSRSQDLLYSFDAVAYFRESQLAAIGGRPTPERADFIRPGPLWRAIEHPDKRPTLLLVDEIDKAPRDFPNDLLHELDRMEVYCAELDRTVRMADPALRPVVVITSNSERRLPEPFLRRCVYHNIVLDEAMMNRILDARLKRTAAWFTAAVPFREAATRCFFALRDNDALQKKPSVDEFWQWLVFVASSGPAAQAKVVEIAGRRGPYAELPSLSALLKLSEDRAQLG